MLTKWGKSMCSALRDSNILFGITLSGGALASITAKTVAGNTTYIAPMSASSNPLGLITSITETGGTASQGVAFGSGTTAATDEDYALETMITTGISTSASPTVTTEFDTTINKYVARVDYTLANSTASDITISEVGRFIRVQPASAIGQATANAANTYKSIMVDRTVLDTPITIPANTSGVVRYQFIYD